MLNKLMVAVDSSEASDRAVKAARDLARTTGANVHLLHVVEHVPLTSGRFSGSFDVEETEDAEEWLAKDLATLREAGVTATAQLIRALSGHIPQQIVEVAETVGADTIVVGSRGRSELTSALLGSTSYKVLHLSHKPVLVVP